MVEQRKPIDRRLALVFAAGLVLGGGAAAWAVLHMNAPSKQPVAATAPAVMPTKAAEPVKVKENAPATVAAQSHVPCPTAPVIAAAGRDDGMMRLKSEPDTPEDISALILAGKESAAAGRPRDAELTFLAACKAADQLHVANASEPTDARYQLARHYSHYVLVGSAPAASRTELLKRAQALYADAEQSYRARYGAEHEKTRFASEGLTALRQSQPTLAQATPATPAAPPATAPAAPVVKTPAPPKAVAAVEPSPPRPTAAPRRAVVEPPPPPLVAEAPRPRRAPRVVAPEPDVIEAPVQQATGSSGNLQ